MPFLALNGITIPVKAGSLKVDEIEIGERGRAYDGSPWSSVRARKRRWSFETTPLTQAEAAAWRALLAGTGHTADFEADTWTAQGINGALAGTAARSAAQKFAGTYSLYAPAGAGNYCQWTLSAVPASWTVAVRRYGAGPSFSHYAWRSDTVGAGHYYDGVYAAAVLAWFAWSSGSPKLGADAGAAHYFDDLLILPFAVPNSWLAQMAAHPRALPALPNLEASGDAIGAAPVVCQPRYAGSRVVAGTVAGSLQHTLETLTVEIEEA